MLSKQNTGIYLQKQLFYSCSTQHLNDQLVLLPLQLICQHYLRDVTCITTPEFLAQNAGMSSPIKLVCAATFFFFFPGNLLRHGQAVHHHKW